ncbi:Ig-like domain-containing protein, partial [Winogradskyella algicola]|uniref:Ig-like domain-containing protein n=1 Tax=Winogradskyella algicola TaxID=2575815 RepID=UPI001FE878EF
MRNKYNCISGLSVAKCILIVLLVILPNVFFAQQSPSIQTGVTFQWEDTQSNNSDPATIQSITIDGTIYKTFVVPTSYEMTRLGPDGHNPNGIKQNGNNVGGNSSDPNWVSNAITAFRDKNLNHYFNANPNGRNICTNFAAAATTDAQKQTIFYSPAIPSNEGGVLAVTERGGNNCFYIEAWGIPAGGGVEQKLGQTFVRNQGNYTNCTFGPPLPQSDYWRSGRCNENGQTIAIGLFYLDDIAPTGSNITKIEFIGATRDHGDGKFFILQKYAVDQTKVNCVDETYSDDLDKQNNVPSGSTYSLVSGPTPAGQSFTLNSDGSYTYVPSPGFVGDVVFDYEVCLPAPNTSVCDTGTVTLSYIATPPAPTYSISCNGTNDFVLTVESPLGPEYEYSIDAGSNYQDSNVFSSLTEGTYSLWVRNKYVGCLSPFGSNPIIIENLELNGTVTNVVCNSDATGAIDITVAGGKAPYTYSWSNSATTEDLINVVAGTYTVTVTDANGCMISDDFTISQPAQELTSTITSTTDILCYGEATGAIDLTIAGGTAPYSILWNNGSTDEDQNNLVAGTYNVTVTDANGCSVTNQSTVQEPNEVVSGSIVRVTNIDCTGETNGSISAEATGGIPPYSYSIDNGSTSQSSGIFENLAAGTYSILITDANGCTTTISDTVNVDDTEDPMISVPASITIEGCSENDITNTNAVFEYSDTPSSDIQSVFASNPNYTASDDFNIASITYIDNITSTGNCPLEVTRTFTITDNCTNTATATQIITVVDTTDPTINIPADVTIECTEDESSANTGVATGADTCGTVTITESDVETAACGNTKTITRTWTATDACGNSVSADQTITVVDTTDPTINVPADVTIECTEDESSANTGVATGADTCSTVTITESDVETAACGNTKTIVRTWTVTDECGNSVSADQTITVVDTTPPTIDNTNTDNIVIQCGVTPDGTLEAWLANNAGATANDTCGTVTWSNDYGANTDVDCANGAITVTFTAIDECGNTANTTATYSIIDTVDPVLTIPADTSVECTDDTSPASTGTATATDDCAVPNVTFSDVEVAACGNTKTITRTWTATDACGNSVSADQTITVVDTTDPTINVPADVTIECTEDESSANTGVATGADTCGTVTITESDVETAACGNTKTIVRTWTVTDECGNSVSADQTITVVDTTDPTINVPADITIECTEDESSANTGVATGADTCGTVTITESDVETAACGNTKTIVRTWTVTDECGNSVSADQTITVVDTTDPTINVPADVTIECTEDESSANTGVATGADTCGTVTITESDVETAACGNTKTIVRTWTVTDECGNSVSADQTITVVDTTDPTINVPADVTIECTEDESSANT